MAETATDKQVTAADTGAAVPRQASRASEPAQQVSGWTGWVFFASMMMLMLGTFHAIQGLVALFNDEFFLVTSSGLALTVDFTAWGWFHLLAGILVGSAGVALLSGKMWARVLGVGLAMLSAVANIAFLGAYPVWSTIMIAICVMVIYALCVHGGELKDA